MKSFDEWARELADGIGKQEEPPIRAIEDEPNIWDVLPTDVEPHDDITATEVMKRSEFTWPSGNTEMVAPSCPPPEITFSHCVFEGVSIDVDDFALARALVDAYWEANKTFSAKMEFAASHNWAVSNKFTSPRAPGQKVQVTVHFDGQSEA